MFFACTSVSRAGAERSAAFRVPMRYTALGMPVSRPHFAPRQLQFITSSTYRRTKLFDGHRFRCDFVTALRNLRDELEKLNCMHNNPVRRALAHSPEEWLRSSLRFYHLNDSSLLSMDRPG
jgi:hypothetical protein